MTNKSRVVFQERVPKIVHQLQVLTANAQSLGLSRAVLLNVGYGEKDLVSSDLKGQTAFELFDENKIKLERVRKLFIRLGLKGVKVRLRRLAPKDWLTLWKSQWKPAQLTKKLDVVPVWYQDKYKPRVGCDHILMDTLLSFGTGLHETTRFMAQFIEDQRGNFRSFLDIGTGTGILALVAIKYGADDVWGIDIGALSVQAARDNMKVNRSYFKVLKADIKKFQPKIKFDLVAANLITEDLIEHAQKILSLVNEDGLLAVSGISLENLKKLRHAFSLLPLKCLKISKGEQWSGILYQKKMS
jgi:ribosomal protein L11 methyltransferase